MNEIVVSVIVPVYKVEKFLNRCVSSIVSQSYRNLEIILVDDGSPDSCPDLCNQWSAKDKRIRVIHQTNRGLSAARNAGLDVATGHYIAFVDSDDWIETDYVGELLFCLIQSESDMAICSIRHENKDGGRLPDDGSIVSSEEIHTPADCLRNSLIGYAGIVAWNKLYASHIWENLRYPIGVTHEDEFIIHHIVKRCTKTVWLPQQLYHYVDNKSGIMGSRYSIKRLDRLDAWIDRIITLCDNDIYADIINELFDQINRDLYYSESLGWGTFEVHAKLCKIFAHFREIPMNVTRMLSKKHIISYWGICICPFLFFEIKKVLR